MDAVDNPSYFSPAFDDFYTFGYPMTIQTWSNLYRNTTLPKLKNSKGSRSAFHQSKHRPLMRATSEDMNLLVLGKPRPSDFASPIHKNFSQRHRSSGNVNYNDLFHVDMVHRNAGDSDVFLTGGQNSQYYNTSTLPVHRISNANKRRHSIGSVMQQEKRTNSNGKENEIRSQGSPSLARMNKSRRSLKGGVKMVEDELDIMLVSCGESKAATQWVTYLISCYQRISNEQKKPPFKLHTIKLEDYLYPLTPCLTDLLPGARLQILVICPLFLQKIKAIPIQENLLVGIIHSENILAMILGVQDQLENSLLRSIFPNFDQWRKMNVKDQDATFVGDFLGVSMDILSRKWQLEEIINSGPDQAAFSLLPKKVNMGQNKLVALLTEPLSSDDVTKVSIHRNGLGMEITGAKRRNPYTLQFTMPACCLHISTLVDVRIEKNGKSLGKQVVKCESKMRELEQSIKSVNDPLQFLCQSCGLNTSDKDELDAFLLEHFQKNTPADFNLFTPVAKAPKSTMCNDEYPTLLHFAARFGLEKLLWQLMKTPGGVQACQIQNSSHMTPADIAKKASHLKLANVLRGFMQMTELSSVYNYLKEVPENDKKITESNYSLPRPLSDTYLIPPAARPVESLAGSTSFTDSLPSSSPYYTNFRPCNFPINKVQPSTSLSSSFGCLPSTFQNYDVPSNGRPYTPRPSIKSRRCADVYSNGIEIARYGNVSSRNTLFDPPHTLSENLALSLENRSSSKCGSVSQLSTREKLEPGEELLEIINDFKNNVFSIAEVETLVENWQNRNDVQQSFREKQEQLNKMREEYDMIQRKMKGEMKKSTPFEKLRRFFVRGKTKKSRNSLRRSVSVISNPQLRPTSSLSLISSQADFLDSHGIYSDASTVNSSKPYSIDSAFLGKLDWKPNVNDEISHRQRFPSMNINPLYPSAVLSDLDSNNVNNRQSCTITSIQECNEIENLESVSIHSNSFEDDKNINVDTAHQEAFTMKRKLYRSKSVELNFIQTEYHIKKIKSTGSLREEFHNKTFTLHRSQLEAKSQTEHLTTHAKLSLPNISARSYMKIKSMKFLSCTDVSKHSQRSATDKCDKTTMSSVSDIESVSSPGKCSSLDLSSLSLNSKCSVDEKEETCVELNITEEGVLENESAALPSLYEQNYTNVCQVPDYMNVKDGSTSSLKEACKYTVVSS